LRAENIGVNVHYIPVHRHPYYRQRFPENGTYPVAEDAYERLISLPMFHSMTAQDVDDVIHALRKVLRHYEMTTDGKGEPSHLLETRQTK
jgi:dTDP-4-amino-4,6-dideoxygalactose transaminase